MQKHVYKTVLECRCEVCSKSNGNFVIFNIACCISPICEIFSFLCWTTCVKGIYTGTAVSAVKKVKMCFGGIEHYFNAPVHIPLPVSDLFGTVVMSELPNSPHINLKKKKKP